MTISGILLLDICSTAENAIQYLPNFGSEQIKKWKGSWDNGMGSNYDGAKKAIQAADDVFFNDLTKDGCGQ